jgi:AbiU2
MPERTETDLARRARLFKQVADRITFASMNYRVWRIYTEPRGRAKYLDVLRRYNSFFLTSLQAHFLATVITLYNLYETRSKSISLSRLVQDASEELRSELRPNGR